MAEHLIVLRRTVHNVDKKHHRTSQPVGQVGEGLFLWDGASYAEIFTEKKIEPKFLAFPIGCESYLQVLDFWHLLCVLLSLLYFGDERAGRLLHE